MTVCFIGHRTIEKTEQLNLHRITQFKRKNKSSIGLLLSQNLKLSKNAKGSTKNF